MGHGDIEAVARFGAFVRAYRREAGLTQAELAAKAGLSVAALRDFEQGRRRPRPSSLSALVNALGLDAAQAVGLARAAAPPSIGRDTAAMASARSWRGAAPRTAGSPGTGQGLWLAALGPLEVRGDGMPLVLGSPRRRALLGLLLMEPGLLVRRDTIVDVLWGDTPPRNAVGLVHAYVSRLRKMLRARDRLAGDAVIESVNGAYRLNLSGQEADVLAFRELAARAAAARASSDAAACELYEQAVGLWRGDPLADVDLLYGHPGVALLRQQLGAVLMLYADVACALGEHRKVLPRLRAFTAAEPLNERAQARLMIALAGCGQQAAALRVYEGLRMRLARELGLYPGDELAEAHRRLLSQDVTAKDPGPAPAYPLALDASPHVVPRQMPAASPSFSGRAAELDTLSSLIEQETGTAAGVVIAAITGMAGIGKTALAVHWTHRVASRFPDGQLFVDLRGFSAVGAPVDPSEGVRYFLTALGVPAARIPADSAGRAGLYRSLLAGRRMLIVLDNARDAEQVRPLLPGSAGCLVLATSRSSLTGLAASEGAHLLTLGALTEEESRALLTGSLGPERVRAEPAAVSELIASCARLPLALRSIAARAAARPSLPLAVLAEETRDERGLLDALETGEPATSARRVFRSSTASLSGLAGRMFRLLALHPGPDISAAAAASLAGLSRNETYLALAELRDGHMVIEQTPGRYACHDLLRAYAAEESRVRDGETGWRAAVHRVLDHYLRTADAASAALYPAYIRLPRDRPLPGVVPENIDGPGQAARWFESERNVLLAAIDRAVSEGHVPHAWKLPWAVGLYFSGERYWTSIAAAQESALALAAEMDDPAG
jgi:DNA-binding SARP family transcriptional activator/transcriptional regulator with XRE-family HTH domain